MDLSYLPSNLKSTAGSKAITMNQGAAAVNIIIGNSTNSSTDSIKKTSFELIIAVK